MTSIDFTLITLLPLIFMFHDFEEIIFIKSWILKNDKYLQQRFPKLSKQILKMKNVSTSTFALGVAEEFILFVAITYFSLLTDNYGWWLGLLVAFTLHIFLHITQFIVVKRYVPAITTSILVLPYCLFTLVKFINMNILFGYLPDTGPIA